MGGAGQRVNPVVGPGSMWFSQADAVTRFEALADASICAMALPTQTGHFAANFPFVQSL